MILNVRTTAEADDHVRAIDEWWRRHRTAVPSLFLDELEAAFTLIASAPNVGRPYRKSPVGGTRRVLLAGCRYHVYYVPLDDELVVLQFGTPAAEADHRCDSSRPLAASPDTRRTEPPQRR